MPLGNDNDPEHRGAAEPNAATLIACLRRYQAALVEFGHLALGPADLDGLFQRATERVAGALEIEHAKVLAHRPEANDLLIVAGVGWKPGVVGHVALPVSETSPPGRAFLTGEPVALAELRDAAPEYEWSTVLRAHGIRSLLNVPIRTDAGAYGVLEVDGTAPHIFTADAQTFLVATATLLGAAIERRRAEDAARAATATAAAERQLFLQELQHRVGNDFQALLAALYKSRKAAKTEHSQTLIGGVIERLEAMMERHRALTAADQHRLTGTVALGDYLTRLAANLRPPPGRNIRVETAIAAAAIAPERAVALGLVLNELVTNAFKHAFPGRAPGTVRVEFAADPARNEGVLIVSDTGTGMGPARPGSAGVALITSLVQRIGGTLTRSETAPGAGGTTYVIRFPLAAV